MHTETELRYKLKDIKKLQIKLVQLGANIVSISKVIDTYFTKQEITSFEQQNAWYISGDGFIVRIRETEDEYNKIPILSVEAKKTDAKRPHEINFEKSIVINDIYSMKEFLNMLGLKEFTKVSKHRMLYKYNNFTICIDDIENFGIGIEVENSETDSKALSNLKDFCENMLQLDQNDKVHKGISYLAFEKNAFF